MSTTIAPPQRDWQAEFDEITKDHDDEDRTCPLCATGKWRPCEFCKGQVHNGWAGPVFEEYCCGCKRWWRDDKRAS